MTAAPSGSIPIFLSPCHQSIESQTYFMDTARSHQGHIIRSGRKTGACQAAKDSRTCSGLMNRTFSQDASPWTRTSGFKQRRTNPVEAKSSLQASRTRLALARLCFRQRTDGWETRSRTSTGLILPYTLSPRRSAISYSSD